MADISIQRTAGQSLQRTLQGLIAELLQSSLANVAWQALQRALKGMPSELLQSSVPREAVHV